MENGKIEIKIDLADVTNKFSLQLKETTDCLTHIYNAIEKSDIDIHRLLPTDSFPILINDKESKPTISEQKQITLNWTLKKAFEDFINGLTKSFKEAYKYLNYFALYKESLHTRTREDLEKEFQKIEIDIERFHFPDFIEKIEKLLKQPIPLKEEILSINQLRNCLIHRHGEVGEKDIKNSLSDDLRLKWISLKFWTNIDGQQTEITYDFRKDGVIVDNLSCKTIKNEKVFKLKDKISLDINEFNDIACTCATFSRELFRLMPRL
ncbi:MAG: hypothetical protein NTX93_01430 [Bacteroidia bacterium]|nr:hypothetical protein [Bacteroidia bacterium]